MAISPGMILVPSNLIIQKKKVPGYNNVLTIATEKMRFGKNTDVNYKAPTVTTKDTQSKSPPKTTQGGPKPTTSSQREQSSSKTNQVNPKPKPKIPRASVASEILGITMMIGGFLISKYIF